MLTSKASNEVKPFIVPEKQRMAKFQMFVLEVAIFLGGIYTSQAAACPVDWHQHGETCYLPITELMSWQKARKMCADQQAQLALPPSQMEQDAVWGMFLEITKGNVARHIWFGCNDIAEEGKFRPCPLRGDDSGAYENWKDGQPDNDNGADCAAMINEARGRWGDRPCTELNFAACQLPVSLQSMFLFCLQTDTSGRLASPYPIG